jgi:hypothetical protein
LGFSHSFQVLRHVKDDVWRALFVPAGCGHVPGWLFRLTGACLAIPRGRERGIFAFADPERAYLGAKPHPIGNPGTGTNGDSFPTCYSLAGADAYSDPVTGQSIQATPLTKGHTRTV